MLSTRVADSAMRFSMTVGGQGALNMGRTSVLNYTLSLSLKLISDRVIGLISPVRHYNDKIINLKADSLYLKSIKKNKPIFYSLYLLILLRKNSC